MSTPEEGTPEEAPPAWAIERAVADLYDTQDPDAIRQHAWRIVGEVAERDRERHDEYDDPDQGGEG